MFCTFYLMFLWVFVCRVLSKALSISKLWAFEYTNSRVEIWGKNKADDALRMPDCIYTAYSPSACDLLTSIWLTPRWWGGGMPEKRAPQISQLFDPLYLTHSTRHFLWALPRYPLQWQGLFSNNCSGKKNQSNESFFLPTFFSEFNDSVLISTCCW